jgi:hypothetical protein
MTDTICAARMPRQTNYVVCGKQPKAAAQTISAWMRPAHDNLVALVDKMLELKKWEYAEPNPQVKMVIERQMGR